MEKLVMELKALLCLIKYIKGKKRLIKDLVRQIFMSHKIDIPFELFVAIDSDDIEVIIKDIKTYIRMLEQEIENKKTKKLQTKDKKKIKPKTGRTS
jgi:hypothetical protein